MDNGAGGGAVAIAPVCRQLGEFQFGLGGGNVAVGAELFVGVGDVVGGDEGGEVEVDLGVVYLGDLLSANLLQRFLQHLHVQIKADRVHLSRLLCPQQVAHTANLHIPHGKLEARPQLGKFLDGTQALTGSIGEFALAGIAEPRMCLDASPSDATPQLVKLGQAKLLGIFDDDRVHTGNIQPRLDDRGAEQQVCLVVAEGEHRGFQFCFGHLSVGDR